MTRTLCLNLFLLVMVLFTARQADAQCDCDFHLSDLLIPGKNIVEGRNVPPGSVVCLDAATPRNGNLLFKRFNGTSAAPIIIMNCGGKYTVNSGTLSFSIKFFGSSHFRLTGTGDASLTYGIEVNGGSQGISVDSLSTNFEIDHLDVHGQNFAGIMAKTDPDCNPATWRENFTMHDIRIHDNYIHSTNQGEGLYIGNSFYAGGVNRTCGDTVIRVYPHAIVGAKIYNNIVFDTGADGIQVGSATQGCEIYDNRIERHGQRPFDNRNDQGNGIQLGEGTGGLCYNNFILNIPPANAVDRTGYSIICLGRGDNVIFNNIMINPSNGGMFVDERGGAATITGPGSGYKIINNTIINPKNNGLLLYSELVEMNVVKNNIIVNPQLKYISYSNGVNIDSAGNYETRNINTVQFADATNQDYHLTSSSPAIGYGVNVSSYGVTFDFDHVARPVGTGWDAGAFESPETPSEPWAIYINAGGDVVNNQWERDKQTTPHPYFDTTYPSLTTGSASSFSGVNNTDAPNAVLGSYRYTSGNGTTIQYNIPVPESNETYKVSLYFARKGGDTFTSGQRRFNIYAEGNLITTYDVYDSTLSGADSHSFTTHVADNTLQLKLVAVSGAYAHINAIAVSNMVTAAAAAANVEPTQAKSLGVSLYPNPVSNYLGIAVDPNNSYTISISDARNQVYSTLTVSGEERKQIDISTLPDNQIYFVHVLSGDGKKETYKVVKSQR
jgi:hypothetical protein